MGQNYFRPMGAEHSFGRTSSFLPLPPSVVQYPLMPHVTSPFSPRSGSFTEGKRGNRTSFQPGLTGFLQPALLGSEEGRLLETSYRPVYPQFLYDGGQVQNGNSSLCSPSYSAGRLGSFHRPFRRLLPHSDASISSEVSAFHGSGSGLAVQSPSVRSFHCPSGFHQTYVGRRGSLPVVGDTNSTISRRLASPSQFQTASPATTGPRYEYHDGLGVSHQPQEVRPPTIPRIQVHRDVVQDSRVPGVFTSGQARITLEAGVGSDPSPLGYDPTLPISHGNPRSSSRAGALRKASSASSTIHSERRILPSIGLSGSSSRYHRRDPYSPPVVAPQRGVRRRSPHLTGRSRTFSVHRRKSVGMGRSSRAPRSDGVRIMASQPSRPHQSVGTTGDHSSPKTVPTPSSVLGNNGSDRQLYSRVIHSPSRGHSLETSVRGNSPTATLVHRTEPAHPSEAHSRKIERVSRQALTSKHCSSSGVVPKSGGSEQNIRQARSSPDRSVRFLAELQAADVRIPSTRTKGFRKGRTLPRLGQSVRLRVPTLQHGGDRDQETFAVQGQTNPGGSAVASEELVHRPPHGSTRPSGVSTPNSGSCLPVQGTDPPPQPSGSQPSRLAVVRDSLRKRNFSERASQFIESSRRQSTRTIYDAKWRVFTNWCAQREINPCQASIPVIADFFVFLFDEKGLRPSTIKGYRAMLSLTLRSTEKEGGAASVRIPLYPT